MSQKTSPDPILSSAPHFLYGCHGQTYVLRSMTSCRIKFNQSHICLRSSLLPHQCFGAQLLTFFKWRHIVTSFFFFRSPLYWLASFYRTCRMVVVLVRFRCWVLAMPISAWYLWTLNGSILLLPTPPLRCSEGGTRCKLHADPDCQSITRFLARHIAHIGTQACGENLANTYFTSVRILLIA